MLWSNKNNETFHQRVCMLGLFFFSFLFFCFLGWTAEPAGVFQPLSFILPHFSLWTNTSSSSL